MTIQSTVSSMDAPAYQPVVPAERIQPIDILRAVALPGILRMNIQTFGLTYPILAPAGAGAARRQLLAPDGSSYPVRE